MRGNKAVEIGSGSAALCSRRLLSTIRSGSLQSLKRELAQAVRICETPLPRNASSALGEEQTELLGAIVEHMSIAGYEPCSEAEIFLLGHLANA
jgi:hypothetical protein